MTLRKIVAPSLAMLLAVLLAPAPAAAEVVTNEMIPFAPTVTNPCTGEDIDFSGQGHAQIRVTIENDIGHVGLHVNYAGLTGTGADGTKYSLTAAENVEGNIKLVNNTGEAAMMVNLHLIGQGPSNNANVHVLVHVTVNANGDATVIIESASIDCSNG